jgi:hypothetical protein
VLHPPAAPPALAIAVLAVAIAAVVAAVRPLRVAAAVGLASLLMRTAHLHSRRRLSS